MKKIIIANWKANPDAPGRAVKLAAAIERGLRLVKSEVVIAPPHPYLLPVSKVIKKAKLGAQNVFWEDVGAYTGEVSWHELKQSGVGYVIVGHSERRRLLNETDEMINKKVLACLKNGLRVVLCIGESKQVRAKGIAAVKKFLANQLKLDLKNLSSGYSLVANHLVIAYEPIWAIGSGKADNPEETVLIVNFIKNFLHVACRLSHVPVLYGGSVNKKNAHDFLSLKEIDGALIGGASLRPKEFLEIVKSAG